MWVVGHDADLYVRSVNGPDGTWYRRALEQREGAMEILPQQHTSKGPADMLTGHVSFDLLVQNEEPSRLRVGRVRFAPGARTAWHSHAVGQTLHVIDGVALVQSRGGDVMELRTGDTSVTPPGVGRAHRRRGA